MSLVAIRYWKGEEQLRWQRGKADGEWKFHVLFSAMRTAWPATRPARSFLKFRAYALNVLPSGFRFLDGDNPADPLIARERRNVLPFCPCGRVRNENVSQIRWYTVDRASGDRFLGHGFHSTSLRNPLGLCSIFSE